MEKLDIERWVEAIPEQRPFRRAVHTILIAIAGNPDLQTNMIMKGGILLALNYESTRFTKDVDFSTTTKTKDFDLDRFKKSFESALLITVEKLDYGLDCRVQSFRQHPPGDDKKFPTIQMTVGYADKSDTNAHRRLIAKKSPQVVRIDYSLNEPIGKVELFEVNNDLTIQIYNFEELVAEKFRALLQQEVRNRIRPQDIYDLHFLLTDHPLKDDNITKISVLKSLKIKSAARDLLVEKASMRNPEIIRRSEADYRHLNSQIENPLPPFDEIYATVQTYYEGLPWDN